MSTLKCPNCSSPLKREKNTFVCPNGHSFDIARKNYVNLLLANQGRRLEEGDSKESIEARRRFLSSNAYSLLQRSLIESIKDLGLNPGASFADIACGEGYYTNAIHASLELNSVGIDISKAAIASSASSRNQLGLKNIEYVVGNLDYLPLLDSSQDVLLNCFAPINEAEFLRVCRKGGYYIRVLPDQDHLLQMKQVLYEEIRLNEPKETDIPGFSIIEEKHIRDQIRLDKQQIADLFSMTPYAIKTSALAKQKLFALDNLETIISFIIRIYQKD